METKFSPSKAKFLAQHAQPSCPECDGLGVVLITSTSDPAQTRDGACSCITYDEPDDDPDAWSGGFASNH